MSPKLPQTLAIDTTLLKPGLRLAVGLSGGADSVALTRALAERSKELGLVLHAAHLHHGLRGEEADGDLAFARALAAELGLPFHETRVDAGRAAKENGETVEEAARRLRYRWFRQLMASGEVEAVATAHTRDDQAETVLAKFLRGAWTGGLSGIYPVIEFAEGRILRPILGVTRAEVEAYLNALGQKWREDSTNRHLTYTRNRIRHELLPLLEKWNPRLREHLEQMATLARDEEAWWQAEVARLAPQLILPGRPVRGGGRAAGNGLALDVTRLAALAPALQRRILRYAAELLGATVDFPATEALRAMALTGHASQRLELAQGLCAERTQRELRLAMTGGGTRRETPPEYRVAVPGEVTALAFGLRLRIEMAAPTSSESQVLKEHDFSQAAEGPISDAALQAAGESLDSTETPEKHPSGPKGPLDSEALAARLKPCPDTKQPIGTGSTSLATEGTQVVKESSSQGLEPNAILANSAAGLKPGPFKAVTAKESSESAPERTATLRNWKPGDRVQLRYSSGPRKAKEVLERLRVTGSKRTLWPVLELDGRIVWMKGVELEPMAGIRIVATSLESDGSGASPMRVRTYR
jgi:tRNA(Ile)-lysidine synthase